MGGMRQAQTLRQCGKRGRIAAASGLPATVADPE